MQPAVLREEYSDHYSPALYSPRQELNLHSQSCCIPADNRTNEYRLLLCLKSIIAESNIIFYTILVRYFNPGDLCPEVGESDNMPALFVRLTDIRLP